LCFLSFFKVQTTLLLNMTHSNGKKNFFVVVEFELRAYTLNHSTSPFLWQVFSRQGFEHDLPGLALNLDPPDLCFLSS
jgi:hypothetical protein